MTPFTLLNTSCFCRCQNVFFFALEKKCQNFIFFFLYWELKNWINTLTASTGSNIHLHPKIHFCSFSLNNSDFCQVDEGWPIHRHTFQTYDFASNPWRCRQLHLFGRQWPGKKRAKFCGTTPSWRTLWTFRDLTEQRRGEGTRWCRDWLSSGR